MSAVSVVSVLQVTMKRATVQNTPEELPESGFWIDGSVCLQTPQPTI